MARLPPGIAPQVSAALSVFERHLGSDLRAVHLYGSAVDGGLKPHSDIDLMVSVSTPLVEATRNELMRELLAHSAPPGGSEVLRPLEATIVALGDVVPWRYPPRREMQFGEWLREDISAGRFESGMADPDLAILMTKLRLHSLSLRGPEAADLFEAVPPSDLRKAFAATIAQWNSEPDWRGDERNIVLALARIWFSVSTGSIASKDAAATWAAERLPPAHATLLTNAAKSYLSGGEPHLASGPLADFIRFCKTEIGRELSR